MNRQAAADPLARARRRLLAARLMAAGYNAVFNFQFAVFS